MKIMQRTIVFACAALLAGGLAFAGEIYKWTDEDGNVHYEDRPIGPGDVEHVGRSRGTDSAAVQARVEAYRESRAVVEQVESEAPEEMSREEIREEAEERTQKCQMYRDRLEAFLRSNRLYREQDSGDRQYLSEEEVLAARTRVEDQIKEYCGS